MRRVGILLGIPQALDSCILEQAILKEMEDRTDGKLTDQARRVSEALGRCFSKLARADGGSKKGRFLALSTITDEQYDRLYFWLNKLATEQEPLAYAAVLQIWLHAHRIKWPPNVFAPGKDLTSPGRGARGKGKVQRTGKVVKLDYKKIRDLQKSGKSNPEIAVALGIAENQTKQARRRAAERLRKALRGTSYSIGSLDEEMVERGRLMLGIPPPREPSEQELQELDDFVKSILGPEYNPADE